VVPEVVAVNGNVPAQRAAADARDITQANVALGIPAVSRHDPDRYPLTILNALLGRGMSSRLFKEVRERRGLAYSVGSSVSRHSDSGMLGISAGVSPENLAEAVKVILDELEKLTQEEIGGDELAKARDYSIGSFRLSLESSMALGQRAGESLLMMGEVEPIEDVVQRLQAVESGDILRVAQRILAREKATLAVVGPDVAEDRVAALLEA
jgi:predicted Zn-dependent peptidase